MRRGNRRSQAYCRECGQPVRWAVTTNGARIPLIPSPDPEGTFMEVAPGRMKQLGGFILARAQGDQEKLWAHHAAACTAGDRTASGSCPPHLRAQLGLTRKDITNDHKNHPHP